MKILILSFYYPPDLSAGSFRVIGLVNSFMDRVGQDIQIEVITTQPNRYKGFGVQSNDQIVSDRLTIHRIKISDHNSGMLDQARSFINYAYEANRIIKGKKFDFVFATSSRLMTATLGAWISKSLKVPLYLDIRDIFVDTIQDVLPPKMAYFFSPIFSLIERLTFNRATHINLVSPGFENYFKRRYPKKSLSFFMNGIDDEFLNKHAQLDQVVDINKNITNRPICIVYAGNVGEGQGLHKIIPLLAKKLGDKVAIKVIGGGGRLKQLHDAINIMGVKNVELIPPMTRVDLLREYEEADVLFLHLNIYKAFEKVLPSKIFEYASLGKPILAGVSGFSAYFLKSEVSNSAIFHPCDVDGAIRALESLSIRDSNRREFVEKYLRKKIMETLSEDILARFKHLT